MRGPGTAPMRILLNSRCVRWSGPRATSAQFLLKINIEYDEEVDLGVYDGALRLLEGGDRHAADELGA
ncbi:hypothetical protein SAMN04489857_1180 [Parafannyhessea umbonata]|uniref:Uncharacterized protein n=1 Tax=Parafannyhessea umbonata TaxID=604330 RepID=A0A1H1LZ29_9ACTN|nr:hypothetical protein SAMN04489857_1180 [Parafannyhessea umbonata]